MTVGMASPKVGDLAEVVNGALPQAGAHVQITAEVLSGDLTAKTVKPGRFDTVVGAENSYAPPDLKVLAWRDC